jgi:hypothetical protein
MLETLEFHLFQPNILENWNPLLKVLQIEVIWYLLCSLSCWVGLYLCHRCWTEPRLVIFSPCSYLTAEQHEERCGIPTEISAGQKNHSSPKAGKRFWNCT